MTVPTDSAISSAPSTLRKTLSGRWLDRQLVPSLAAIQRRLEKQAFVAALACALASATGAAVCVSAAAHGWIAGLDGYTFATILAITASLVTAAGFYPFLRHKHAWFLRAASTVAHINIEWLALVGKLIELRDPETNGHNLRVTLYSVMFAEALGMSSEAVVRIIKGALLHDIGKLVVPDHILGKPGPLNPEERKAMETHVQYGLDLVAQAEVLNEAVPVVAAHHERYDGSGYPLGLRGDEIPYEAKVFALIDVFDALTSQRCYKPAFSVTDALTLMIQERGSHFDPALFDRFICLAPAFAHGLPREEAALMNLLQDCLQPYLEHFTHIQPVFAESGPRAASSRGA